MRVLRVISSIGLLVVASRSFAQGPQIAAVYPPGGAAGSRVSARIEGANLAGATAILISEGGVSLRSLGDGKDANGIPVDVEIASDAPAGPRELRVVTQKGASNPAYFWVGNLPELAEIEPNNQTPQAQHLGALPATVYGRANSAEDVDWYSFTASAGDTFVIESCSFRIFSPIDCYLELQDARGRFLPPAGTEGYDRDPRIIYKFSQGGTYRLQVRDLSYRGGPGFVYRVSIGKLPVFTSVFPRGGKRGQKLEAAVQGVNIGDMSSWTVDLAEDRSPFLPWVPTTPNGPALPLELGVDDNPSYREPGPSSASQANSLPALPVTVDGILTRGEETDFYQFEGRQGQTIRLAVTARRIRSRLDALLKVFDPSGKEVLNTEEQIGRDPEVSFTPAMTGRYRVQISGIDGRGGPEYFYRLSISPPGEPDFSLAVSPDVFLLGKGQTMTANVTAVRSDFNGEINVLLRDLPAGISASPLTLAVGQSSGMITLTASPDAPLSTGRFSVYGEAALEGGKTASRLARVSGAYPHPAWGQVAPRPVAFLLASATDTVPLFTLAPESSKVEILPGQRIEVKIRVARKPGDNNANPAIALSIVNLPPGLKAETPNISEKALEGTIKLIAPEDAKPGQSVALLSGKLGENSQPAPGILIIVKSKP